MGELQCIHFMVSVVVAWNPFLFSSNFSLTSNGKKPWILLFTYSLSKYLITIYYEPGILLSVKDTEVNGTEKKSLPL